MIDVDNFKSDIDTYGIGGVAQTPHGDECAKQQIEAAMWLCLGPSATGAIGSSWFRGLAPAGVNTAPQAPAAPQCNRITGCTRRRNQWLAVSSAIRAKPVSVITCLR